MNKDKEFDNYLNNLDPEEQMALNAYMDNLDLEDNPQLDEYLDHIEEIKDELEEEPVYAPKDNVSYLNEGVQPQDNASGLRAYIELEPEIESFQDYTTSRMKPIRPEMINQSVQSNGVGDINENYHGNNSGTENPLEVSLLDTEYEAPVIDTLRYKGIDDESDASGKADGDNKNVENTNNNAMSEDIYDSVVYVDNSPLDKKSKKKRGNKKKSPAAFIIVLLLLIVGGGVYAVYHFSEGFTDFAFVDKLLGKEEEPTTEATTQEITTEEITTEEATTEEEPGPYATVDYTLHTPHTTDSTIVYNSNAYSLRYSPEEWPIQRDDSGNEREATQEDLYPTITLEAVEGSLNSTSPDPSNLAETQILTSRYMVLVDLSDDSIVAKRDSDVVVNPASMTKILTVLTAADMIEDLDDTFIMTDEAIKYAYDNDGSAVGFLVGEKVTVRDLIYGTIVCSGADAAVGLAQYCCGSHEAFVEKMNEKAEELGISDTAHFTNVVGMYDENLHCTMEDMAVILSTAVQNELLMDVLNTRVYQTTPDPTILPEDVRKELGIGTSDNNSGAGTTQSDGTDQTQTDSSDTDQAQTEQSQTDTGEAGMDQSEENDSAATGEAGSAEATTEEIDPGVLLIATDGIQISNWFMRRIEDKNTGGEVLGAKTGYVSAAGFCCASYYKSNSGKEYVCVTGDTYSSWRCIYDHVGIYRSLAK